MAVPFLACMVAAASFYHLPPRVLPSIQAVEGGQVGVIHLNTNSTADLGLMQINTVWIEPLARYAHLPPETVFVRLRDDACFNIAAAAAVMRLYMTEAHGDLLTAVGYYHSHTPDLGIDYQRKVMGAATTLFNRPGKPSHILLTQPAVGNHHPGR